MPAFAVKVEQEQIEHNEELRQRYIAFLERTAWNDIQVSRDMQRFFGKGQDEDGRRANLGLSDSNLYAWRALKWVSSQPALTRIETKIQSWLDHREHGGKVSEIDETIEAAKLIQYGLRQAAQSKKFVAIIGPSGMGKSLITINFANVHTRGGLVYVEAYDGMTARSFLAAIARALGEIDTGSLDLLLQKVKGSLSAQPRLLAIDEANFLKVQSVNHLVNIHNQQNIGIALLGTEELSRTIHRSELQRVKTRMKIEVILRQMSDEDIRRRLEQAFEGKDVTPRVIELVRQGSVGSYRAVDTIIETALDWLDANPQKSLEEISEMVAPRLHRGRERKRA